jgi:hypothetical protein
VIGLILIIFEQLHQNRQPAQAASAATMRHAAVQRTTRAG